MKYFVFAVAAAGVPPLAALLVINRRWTKYVMWALIAALAVYQSTAINFFSHEEYRGSARGMEISVAYLFAMAIILASVARMRFPGLLPSVGAKLYFIYFLLCLPSWTSAENTLFCWLETWKMIMIYLVYLGVRAFLDMTDDMKSLLRGLAAFAVLNFIMVVKDHLQGVYQPHGVFPHQNCLAMAMHIFGSLFLAFCLARGWKSSPLWAMAFISAAACVVRTYSRGAIAGTPVWFALTFFCVAAKSMKGSFRRLFKRVMPFAILGLIGLGIMLPRIIERFKSAPEASKNTRIELALCAKEMIIDEPWRGVGINNWGLKINEPYDYAYRAGRSTNRGGEFKDGVVETVYLLVGAECGLPALAAMIVWFVWYLVVCLRLVARLGRSRWAPIPCGLFGGFVVCYLQSCLEWVLRQQMNLILLMVFFAMLDYLDSNWRRLKSEETAPKENAK